MKQQIAPLHPELQASAKALPTIKYNSGLVWFMQRSMFLLRGKKSSEGILIENHFIPTDDKTSKIRLRVYKPRTASTNAPVMLWIHGGGYVIGKPEINEAFYLQLVHELGMVIVAPAYRLAPDNPFPKPLDDCYTALRWLHAEAKALGVDTQRLAIGGESAGGGLAAALVQQVHDRKEYKPIFQMLVYPMLDDKSAISSEMAKNNYLVWTQDSNRFGWEAYLGAKCGTADLPAYAVPARRSELSGLPPAWIGVGTLDLFHDEDLLYAQRLQEAGVPCELKLVQGAFHGFDIMAGKTQVVADFRQSQINALKKYLVGEA